MATSVIRAVVGKAAPQFAAKAWVTASQSFQTVDLKDYKSKWVLLFFYPLDFTFVCPTEIVEFSNKAKMFRQINCEVLGCSVDSHFSHMEYTKKARADGGIGPVDIPLIADITKEVSDKYGVLSEAGIAFRGSFIIDDTQVVRHASINDLPVGRNVDELLRLVKAFQYVQKNGEVCPSSWKPGDRAMTPDSKSDKLTSFWKEVHAKK